MIPSPALLQELSRARLRLGGATAAGGTGERRSRQKGPGMEFADYRPYETGDDFRHLDAGIYARRSEFHVREYEAYRPARITVLIDASLSMDYGASNKFAFAGTVGSLLAFAGLAGGDSVQMAVWSGERLHLSPRATGVGRASALFEWLAHQKPAGAGFARGLRQTLDLAGGGLVIVISDWLDEAISPQTLARAAGVDLLALQVFSREEAEPEFSGDSEIRLRDAESGIEFDFTADRAAIAEYRQVYADWQDNLRRLFLRAGARHLQQRSDMDMMQAVRTEWRRQGILE